MIKRNDSNARRIHRHKRVRAKISGTSSCPRLCVYRSQMNIYAQVIDDIAGTTLCSASTVEKDFADYGGNKDAARKVGKAIAGRAKAKGNESVGFDRGGFVYHGRIQALAEGAREGGLVF
jgi:large subunit ribosomal protein L18